AKMIKNQFGNKHIIFGGPHVTFLPDEALKHSEFVVRGEGEETIVELLAHIDDLSMYPHIKGLSYRLGIEKFHNEDRELVANLDDEPFIDFSIVKGFQKNFKNLKKSVFSAGKVYPIITSRGCPHMCEFCSVTRMFGRKYRFKSVDRVINELREAKNERIFFYDDNFTANKRRSKELLQKMIELKLTPPWSAQVRIEIAEDEELLSLMKNSGCTNVFIGFESVNPKTLKLFKKEINLENIGNNIKNFQKYGIEIHGMFILGSDEDDMETIKETRKFAKRLGLDTIQFLILVPVPGTPVFKKIKEDGRLITEDWSLYDAHFVVFKPNNFTPFELQIAVLKATLAFYSWSSVLDKFLQGNALNAIMRTYGRLASKKWMKINKGYITNLKEDLYSITKEVRKKRLIKKLAVPESLYQNKQFSFMKDYFRRLGVKLLPISSSKDSLDNLKNEHTDIQTSHYWLKKGVDGLIVPFGDEGEVKLLTFFKSKIESVIFPYHQKKEYLYNWYAKIGLLFTKKISTVRKAYFKVLERQTIDLQE
ncbi:MAG: radical SAM protein, partial [Thermodesulfobacteriota bacterium]|nr:radical SAM protein [Thermodesulfobacteriota bacterium]